MLSYDLTDLAKRKTRRRDNAQLPQIHGSVGAEASYLRTLRVMLRALGSAVRVDLLVQVEREAAAKRFAARLQRDVDGSAFEHIAQLGNSLASIASVTVEALLRLEAKRHTRSFMASARQVLGVDLSAVVLEEDLVEYLETATARNVGLIRGLAQDTVKRVQQSVTTAVLAGTPASDLRKTLTDDFGISDRRAKMIARDQIAKTTSDLNRIRHEQAGLKEYIWRTSHDERVRPRHQRLDGLTYQYGEPTGAEDGLPPGQPILCRCVAQVIVTFN